MVGGCLGHSDHEMVEFKIFCVIIIKDSRVATLDFRRANFKLFRQLFSRVLWKSAFEDLGVQKCWSIFKILHRSRQLHCVSSQARWAED